MFGDIIGILDSNYNELVTYEYDYWGALVNITDNSNIDLGTINPFRYRSYYYDTETGLYYLNSRYYNPITGRYLNSDVYFATGGSTEGYNMFSYCTNNPVNIWDPNGNFSLIKAIKKVVKTVSNAVETAGKVINNAINTVTSTISKTITKVTTSVNNAMKKVVKTISKSAKKFINTTQKVAQKAIDDAYQRAMNGLVDFMDRCVFEVGVGIGEGNSFTEQISYTTGYGFRNGENYKYQRFTANTLGQGIDFTHTDHDFEHEDFFEWVTCKHTESNVVNITNGSIWAFNFSPDGTVTFTASWFDLLGIEGTIGFRFG